MNRVSLPGSFVIGVLLCVWSAQGYAADITIDNFQEGAADMTVNVSTPTATDVDAGLSTTNVIGGERKTDLIYENETQSGDITLTINDASNGLASYASPSGVNGYFELTYGNSSFLDADLTDSGLNCCFGLLFDEADFEGDIDITVWTGETNSGTASAKTPTLIPEGEDEWVYINFSAFSGSLNFADVDKIKIKIDGPSLADYTVKEIVTTIPEPSVLALLGFGGLAFLASARRRFRKS